MRVQNNIEKQGQPAAETKSQTAPQAALQTDSTETPDADRVLSLDDRKQRLQDRDLVRLKKQREREEALAGAGGARTPKQKLRDRVAEAERLDADDDLPSRGAAAPIRIAPPARAARVKERHWGVLFSFVLLVMVPVAVSGWYLWTRATDRYVSMAGFSVRTEDTGSAFELLGGLANMGSSSSSDTDILYKFIQSQEMVATINAELDLRTIWAKADPVRDPIYAYHPPGTIEDIVNYWGRMVTVYNDTGTGLIDIEVQAFTPEDAQMIAKMIYDESSIMINELSDIAQEDATRFSRQELDEAVERLKDAREAVTRFRNVNQIVDPSASIQSQMGILSSLDAELATTLIDLDILRLTTAESDPRIVQAERRVEVIEARMQEERDKLGIGTGTTAATAQGEAFADLVGEYERLIVDQTFAEQSYAAARAAFDAAVSESRRQSRYLAAHVHPTLAERAEKPARITMLGLVAVFAFLIWSMLVLASYALKDRR